MTQRRPLGITLIGCFEVFGAIVLLLTLGVEQDPPMNVRFGVPNMPETVVRVLAAVVALVMAYGYLTLRKWGYWSMIVYSLLFAVVSLSQMTVLNSEQPFLGNAIYSVIVLVYTLRTRQVFYGVAEAFG